MDPHMILSPRTFMLRLVPILAHYQAGQCWSPSVTAHTWEDHPPVSCLVPTLPPHLVSHFPHCHISVWWSCDLPIPMSNPHVQSCTGLPPVGAIIRIQFFQQWPCLTQRAVGIFSHTWCSTVLSFVKISQVIFIQSNIYSNFNLFLFYLAFTLKHILYKISRLIPCYKTILLSEHWITILSSILNSYGPAFFAFESCYHNHD